MNNFCSHRGSNRPATKPLLTTAQLLLSCQLGIVIKDVFIVHLGVR